MKQPVFSIKNCTPEGRVFIIYPDLNRMEWEATSEIGPIGIPLKNGQDDWMDLMSCLKNGEPFNHFFAV